MVSQWRQLSGFELHLPTGLHLQWLRMSCGIVLCLYMAQSTFLLLHNTQSTVAPLAYQCGHRDYIKLPRVITRAFLT